MCEVLGSVDLPIRLRDRMILLDVLVVPSIPHSLILGVEFWLKMGIVPDLLDQEWHFNEERRESLT